MGERLDRHDRLATAFPEADREPGTRQRAVRRVDIAVLELGRPGAPAARGEGAEPIRREDALGCSKVSDAVLQLDLRHARGSNDPAPAPGRRGTDATAPDSRARSLRISNIVHSNTFGIRLIRQLALLLIVHVSMAQHWMKIIETSPAQLRLDSA